MTEQAPEQDETWGDNEAEGATYPERPDNPHEAPLSVNFKPGGTPQLTVRGRTVQEHMELLEQVQSSGLLGLISSVSSLFGDQGAAPAPQAPPQQPWNQQPAQPMPNQPYQGQPAWQTAGAPQASQQNGWGGQPQQQSWGGGQRQGGGQGQGNKPQPKQQPAGWWRTDKNSGPGADAWKAWREQNQGALKGKIQWGGGSTFWVDPSVVQMVGSAGFVVVAA